MESEGYNLIITQLGIEIAKNLILAGPKKVTLSDNQLVKVSDLGSNFYLKEHHVGSVSRAEAVLEELSNLNPSVNVSASKDFSVEFISSNFDCVVITDHYDREYLTHLNKVCRQKGIGFIYTGNLGLYGFAFVDFGDDHRVHDPNGEQCKSTVIVGITKDPEGIVFNH